MEQKDLSKKTSPFLGVRRRSYVHYKSFFLDLRLAFFSLLLTSISISCSSSSKLPALHQGVFQKSPGKAAIVIVIDVPYKVMQIGKDEKMSFYPWILWAFRASSYVQGNKYVMFDAQTIISQARIRGIPPVVQYGETWVDHLAFHETDSDRLCIIADELGASYLIRARLVKSDIKIKEESSKSILPSVSLQISGKTFETVTRDVTVEFTVYDPATRKILLTKEFNSTETASWPKSSSADDKVSINIASALLSTLSSFQQSQFTTRKETETTISIGKTVVLGRSMFRNSSPVRSTFEPQCEITLNSVTKIGTNLLRFDLSLWNKTEERVYISFKRNNENKLDTYIVDNFNVRYFSTSSSLNKYTFQIRGEEKKSFYFVFPVPVLTVRSVAFYSTWEVRTYNLNETSIIEFKDIAIQ